ncbi:MAG TPA: hypothetical protein VGT82_02240, partial [Ktedonobacteraceae bacterium]|nr:hypothetical protein [Ktedonobacteraceae bacterium]
MALHEERSEQNQQTWGSRVARERQDLSASVEEALADTDAQAPQWSDDEQSFPGTSGTPLVPPRLSLQSRAMPTVQPAGLMNATTSEHSALLPGDSAEAEQRPSGEARTQSTSMLTRLAQRFTSSFAAIGGSTKAAPAHHQAPEAARQVTPLPQDARQIPLSNREETAVTRERPDAPLVRVIDTAPSSTSAMMAAMPSTRGQGHSLRRNAKVRLETTVLPAIPKTPATRFEEQETGEELRSAQVRDALSRQQAAIVRREEVRSVSPQPILEMFEGQTSVAARGSLSGTGTFECGQSDATMSNTRITAASVVQVTLTSNPGPVVVQYISLQPRVG